MIGQTVAHYRVVERIGAGGMGEVYRAHDLQLDRDIALKVLPGGTLSEEPSRRQFRSEALALARLNHPNIATVHEFSVHEGMDFIAMELISGTPLSQRLAERPLTRAEILRFGTQLADGLAAAHESRVVHRDLKPGNLMITADGRLKILDFGLARLLRPAEERDLTQSVTVVSGAILGTVPYMSPEQLRGLPADERSDIYAAGAVLYEMATGRRPFRQSQRMELIGAILHQAPDPPASADGRMPEGLANVILKALEKSPDRRYQSSRELQAALEGIQTGTVPRHAALRRPLIAVASAAMALVLAAALVLALNPGGIRDRLRSAPPPAAASAAPGALAKSRQSVAVLGFKNVAGRTDDDWLSTALSEMMTTELAAGEQLRTIPGETVARMKMNLALSDADSYGRETLDRIQRNIDADHVVLGSYIPLGGGQLRLDLRLQDTSAGEILLATSVKGDDTAIDDLVSRGAAALRERLGAGKVTAAEAVAIRATLPQSRDTARYYAIGLQSLRQFHYQRARESLERAVESEPQFALAHSALALAWKGLGYDKRASEAARKAYDLSTGFSREERLWIEGQYHEITSGWAKAIETYKTLFDFFPDNLDYGLRLAAAQTSSGRGTDALATLDAVRGRSPSASGDPRFDLAGAAAAASLGDFRKQQVEAATAVGKADSQGARLLAAHARVSECSALRYLGKPAGSIARCEEARQIFATAGDRAGAGRALNAIGVAHMEQGDFIPAKKAYDEALVSTRELGDKRLEAMVLNNYAGVLRGEVDLAGSRKMLEGALSNFREIDDKGGVARSLDNIGIVLMDEGKPDAARKAFEQSLVICREIGNKSLSGYALYLLGNVHLAQANLSAAKQRHTEALALRKEIADHRGIGLSELALAKLAIEAGEFAAAESIARQHVQEFQKVGSADEEALARTILVQALLAQRQSADAALAIEPAVAQAKKTGDVSVRLSVAIDAARVHAASGTQADVAGALKALRDASNDAAREGLTGVLFQARLALGQLEIEAGQRAAGRARLLALQKEAAAKGFLLVARKAAAAVG
jgi:tetratricopeptide (TPR) repeat protein/tRNA A-37 threonylcarbamoyl transferase component Bud32/TolB-like protein